MFTCEPLNHWTSYLHYDGFENKFLLSSVFPFWQSANFVNFFILLQKIVWGCWIDLLVLVCGFIARTTCSHKAEHFINYSRAITIICGRRPFYTASIVEQFITPNWIGMFGGLFQTDSEHLHFFVSFLVVALQ
jgi:hypothetical protein